MWGKNREGGHVKEDLDERVSKEKKSKSNYGLNVVKDRFKEKLLFPGHESEAWGYQEFEGWHRETSPGGT